jgi:hypothetical protein
VKRPAQGRIGQGRAIPNDGPKKISRGRTGETGEHPLGLAIYVGEAPIGIEGKDALANPVEQIQRLCGVEQPNEPLVGGEAAS